MNKIKHLSYIILAVLLMPSIVFAHAVDGTGFYAGLSHPVGGLDHSLAMLSVGILSTQMKGKHIWSVPSVFVIVMLFGGVIGFLGIDIESVIIEHIIVLSVILLGLVIAFGGVLSPAIVYCFVGMFGFAHGYAHGVEMPIQANPFFFAIGFMLSTIVIHIIGVLIGFTFAKGRQKGMLLLQYTGAIVMGMGLQMLLERYLG